MAPSSGAKRGPSHADRIQSTYRNAIRARTRIGDCAGFLPRPDATSPRLSSVAILPKRGRIHNEMTRFRYDVVLRVEAERAFTCPPEAWEDWRDGPRPSSAIGERLAPRAAALFRTASCRRTPDSDGRAVSIGLPTIPGAGNGRWNTAGGGAGTGPAASTRRRCGNWGANSYDVDIRCEPESGDGDFAVLFTRRDSLPVDVDAVLATAPLRSFADCANNPLLGNVARALVPEFRRHLKATCRSI